ncbi:MAG: glycosyltransferase [Gemmatimonadaceae bacterium]|nr:glycosyltransferase [Gemmatimonadaceae bacterium]
MIAYADRIDAEGQPFILARTMRQLRERSNGWIALIAGNGPDLDWLHGFVARNNLTDNVRILAGSADDDMRHLMLAANVYFCPSQSETINAEVLRAMACGLPVVGEEGSGLAEVVTDRCGVLIPHADEELQATAYAAVLLDLLNSPERARALGEISRDVVRRLFSAQALGEEFKSLLGVAMTARSRSDGGEVDPDRTRLCSNKMIESARRLREIDANTHRRLDRQRALVEEQQRRIAEQDQRIAHEHALVVQQERRLAEQDQHIARVHADVVVATARVLQLDGQLLDEKGRVVILERRIASAILVKEQLRGALEVLGAASWVRLGRRLGMLRTPDLPHEECRDVTTSRQAS